ncbi:hypothetical protein CDAR_453841 [Caerostris darwini]|uniref:Uncharacterized protein n=1 Tax=Caerostris darwini TaxID=1538125 RepID=A0AAV4UCS8_9ARAC|nr:hypothetical protein CDAR_453841 [Caerostris darwini]
MTGHWRDSCPIFYLRRSPETRVAHSGTCGDLLLMEERGKKKPSDEAAKRGKRRRGKLQSISIPLRHIATKPIESSNQRDSPPANGDPYVFAGIPHWLSGTFELPNG